MYNLTMASLDIQDAVLLIQGLQPEPIQAGKKTGNVAPS
jgi:hypothetical protein